MTRSEARRRVHDLWSRLANGRFPSVAGDRMPFIRLRLKRDPDRHEVGYHEIVAVGAPGVREVWNEVILGRGPTWAIAIERAIEGQIRRSDRAPAGPASLDTRLG